MRLVDQDSVLVEIAQMASRLGRTTSVEASLTLASLEPAEMPYFQMSHPISSTQAQDREGGVFGDSVI